LNSNHSFSQKQPEKCGSPKRFSRKIPYLGVFFSFHGLPCSVNLGTIMSYSRMKKDDNTDNRRDNIDEK
jgi:hypothetical protein